MDFELSDDQVALQSELRRFLTDRVDADARRAIAALPGAVDRELWRALGELGVFGLTTAEADGGVGLGHAESAIVFEELGRALVPGPVVATALAAGLVDGAVTGDVVVGMVADATPAPTIVEHLDALDVLLVVGTDAVTAVDPPRGRAPVERPLDPLTPVTVVTSIPDGPSVAPAGAFRRDGALLAAAMQVGIGAAAVDLATAYAKERQQFGRKIGGFQAVKHLLADAFVAVEIARAAVHAAAVGIDEGWEGRAVASARVVASRAARLATATCVQVHGGMGYTWELDAHLLLKRALVLDLSPGTVDEAIDAIAAGLR